MSVPSPTRPAGECSREESSTSDDEGPETTNPEIIRLRARVRELETELQRKDHELYEVRRQYEALLAEREEQEDGESDLLAWLR